MLGEKEAVFNAMEIFKSALANERKSQLPEAIIDYSNVADIYYASRYVDLKYVCLLAVRCLVRLSRTTEHGDCWILRALYHCEKLPWVFVNEHDPAIRLCVVDILCEGIALCLDCEEQWQNHKTAEQLFKSLKVNYRTYPDRTIQRRIVYATTMMKKHKEKK